MSPVGRPKRATQPFHSQKTPRAESPRLQSRFSTNNWPVDYWWHRIAVNQRSYSLQGWQRQRVYPDLLACLHGTEDGKYRFSVLETKGEHLKGNDDTEYKRKLFELLTGYTDTAIRAGELALEEESQAITFTLLMEDTWAQELAGGGIV